MFLTLLIIAISTCSCSELTYAVKGYCTVNVGTVLFREKDQLKECWSSVDLSLLLSRFQLQQLLPYRRPTDMHILLNYITLWMQVINEESSSLGESEGSVIKDALSDVLGGYLQVFALPMVRELLYEGKIDVKTAVKLEKLHQGVKAKLCTNGKAWRSPVTIKKPLSPIKPALINCIEGMQYCKTLASEPLDTTSKNRKEKDNCNVFSKISMPILDNCKSPQAIALPLKNMPLVNLHDASSGPVLMEYFTNVMCCAESQGATNVTCLSEKVGFLNRYNNWLKTHILPITNNENLFPAFQSSYELMKTVALSLKSNQKRLKQLNLENTEKPIKAEEDETNNNEVDGSNGSDWIRLSRILLYFLIFLAVLCVLICLCRMCCRKIRVKRTSEMIEIKMSTDDEGNTSKESMQDKSRRKSSVKSSSDSSNSKGYNYATNYMIEVDRSGVSDCETTHYGDDSESDLIDD